MKTGQDLRTPTWLVFILSLCIYRSQQLVEPQVCKQCRGTVPKGSEVGKFCSLSSGRVVGRCCLANETSNHARIIGLDLSNCSLTHADNLQEASDALIIDLSSNAIINMNDSAFQGFSQLRRLFLPADIACPGGNSSWDKVKTDEGIRLCEGQRNMCNQSGKMPVHCPEYSHCAAYGPGFFECSCADDYHGYKCLREGEFPALWVFGLLGASTLALSLLLWLTQRRKAKSL